MSRTLLAPLPRTIKDIQGYHLVDIDHTIFIETPNPPADYSQAEKIKEIVKKRWSIEWQVEVGRREITPGKSVILRIANNLNPVHPQGYHLEITPDSCLIESRTNTGLFYGVCTFAQLLTRLENFIPCLEVNDWPDFESRGVMLDISRDKVYRQDTLFQIVDWLASLKINHIQLYMEHTFAYPSHPIVWQDSSPITGEEIILLDRFCRERHIKLVPNQNSLGHLHRWLKHPKYAHLAETHDVFSVPWGMKQGPFSLAPTLKESKEFISGLYDELLPYFTCDEFNIGCDETYDIGCGKSKLEAERIGTEMVYLNYLLDLYQIVKQKGYTPQFWGDIILKHPTLISKLPKDMVALLWGYEAEHPFEIECKAFERSGLPYYVCPGTSSWNSILGRTSNCTKNIQQAVKHGLTHNAKGVLITDWGDNGHWQTLPISFLGLLYSACCGWHFEANSGIQLPEALSVFGFNDSSGELGKIAYEAGDLCLLSGYTLPNSSPLFWLLSKSFAEWRDEKIISADRLLSMLEKLDSFEEKLISLKNPSTSLYIREFLLSISMAKHACKRGCYIQDVTNNIGMLSQLKTELCGIIDEYQAIWFIRNRPGGYKDSVNRLIKLFSDYY